MVMPPSPQPEPSSETAPSDAVDTLLELVMLRQQGRLSAHQIELVRAAVRSMLDAGARLNACQLTNADAPDFVFVAYPDEG